MAKKKNKIESKSAVKDSESMVSKVEVKSVSEADQDRVSRILGTVFILLGLAFVVYGIISFVRYSRNPQFNGSYQAPFLSGSKPFVNKEEFDITGVATGYDEVFIYVNDSQVGKGKVNKDGNFEYKYKSAGDGKYSVSVAGVKGFPKRYISTKSDPRIIEVDRVAPVLASVNYLSEVGTETFSITGKVEPSCEVTLKRGTNIYREECNENGDFLIKGALLDEGMNVYTLEIKDRAGNITEVAEKVKVTYSKKSTVNGNVVAGVADLNGNGVSDSTLPLASGEISNLLNSKLMTLFAMLAIAAFMTSSGVVMIKRSKE